MIVDPEYIREVFGIRYKLKTSFMTKLKDDNKAKAKDIMKIVSDCRILSII